MTSFYRLIMKHAYLTSFILGLFSAYAYAPYFFFPILILAFSFLIKNLNNGINKRQTAGIFFCYGAGTGITSMAWIANALLIDGGQFALFIAPALAGMGIFFGLFWLFPALFARWVPAGVRRWLAFACFFVFFEWIRSWFLTGFPWNLIGSIWTDYPYVLQFASVFGVYGLSFVTLVAFSSPALLPNKKPLYFSLLLMLLITGGGALRLYQAKNESVFGVHLRLVQPNIAQTLKWNAEKREENISKLLRLSRENNTSITHVIWPESALPYLIELNTTERLRLMSAVRQGGTLITGGLRVVNQAKKQLANSVFLLNDLADIVGYVDKSHLVPFGEYVPLRQWLPLEKVVPIDSDFVAGQGITTHHIPKAPPAAVSVCYEIIFPHAVAPKKPRPDWIINVTNDGWYGLSAGPYQHLGMAQLRAVEEGLPVARAANTGISAVINPYGIIEKSLPLNQAGVVDSSLPRALPPTVYARYGNVLWLTLTGFIFLFCFIRRKTVKK